MTFGQALTAKWLGMPVILWIILGATGYYLTVHHLQNGAVMPQPLGVGPNPPVSPSQPGLGGGYGLRPQIYLPDFPMPVVVASTAVPNPPGTIGETEYTGVHY